MVQQKRHQKYQYLLYNPQKNWAYKVKEVDRRLSYFLVKEGDSVCDVGGGQGVDAFAFANKGAFVVNLDLNKIALKNSKEFAKQQGFTTRLSFIRASATNLPFKDEILDLVTCFSTLDHLPNKKSAYNALIEFSRVVRPSGHVALTVPNQLFFIGTISMKLKNLGQPEAFPEQRFTPKQLWSYLTSVGLKPVIFDSEYPRSVGPGMLEDHFPSILQKAPGIITFLTAGAKFLELTHFPKYFGARMGYLSKKENTEELKRNK